MINKTNDNVDKRQPGRRKRIHDISTIEFHTSREKIVWGDHSPAVGRGAGGAQIHAFSLFLATSGRLASARLASARLASARLSISAG